MYRFKCDGQELRCIVHDTAASGYIDTVNAAFELCKRWDGMDVTVQYTQTQNGAERTFNEHLDSATGEAKVSNSLIDGPVKVSIFGYIRETGARLTSEPCEIHINKSGYKENGEPSLPPEPDLYAHLLHEVDEIVKKGISDRQVADAVNAHLAEHPPKVETDTTLAIPGDAADAAAVGEALDTLEKEKLSASDLPTAIDDALAKAKASGEFDGADGKPGADGAPGKDGFTPTLTLERVEDGMQVKATNADGEQVETVYDGTRNVFVANSNTTAAEIRAAVKAKKVCIYIDNGVVYTYDGESEYGLTFRAVPLADAAKGTLTERYARFESDGLHRYSMGGRKFANPQKLKLTGVVEAEYDGSTTTTVEIPSADVFIVHFSIDGECDKTYREISEALYAKKVCVAVNNATYSTLIGIGFEKDMGGGNYAVPTFFSLHNVVDHKITYVEAVQIGSDGVAKYYIDDKVGIINPHPLTINGTSYDGSEPVDLTIEGGTGGGSGLPDPTGPHMALVTDKDGNWSQAERLAYPITGTVEVVPETTLYIMSAEDGMAVIMEKPVQVPEVGKTYTVEWNGTPYTCVAQEFVENEAAPSTVGIGNGVATGGEDTGEPFFIIYAPPEMTGETGYYFMVFVLDALTETSEIKVKITGEGTTYKKVSFDYLPEGVGGVESGVVLPEVTLTASEDYGGAMVVFNPLNMPITIGSQYTVLWNGAEYKCIAQLFQNNGMSAPVIGDIGLMTGGVSTGEPFTIIDASAIGQGFTMMIQPLDGSETATVSISGESIRKIDPKYIDLEWMPEMQDVGEEILPPTYQDTGTNNISLSAEVASKMSVGMTVIVYVNDKRYRCTLAPYLEDNIVGGNLSLAGLDAPDTGEPFYIAIGPGTNDDVISLAGLGYWKVAIYAEGSTGKIPAVLPKDYMPDMSVFYVDLTKDGDEYKSNRSFEEIEYAFMTGRLVRCRKISYIGNYGEIVCDIAELTTFAGGNGSLYFTGAKFSAYMSSTGQITVT